MTSTMEIRRSAWSGRVRRIARRLSFFGVDPRQIAKNIAGIRFYLRDARSYARMAPPAEFQIHLRDLFPVLNERAQGAGLASGHYFHQDLWAARKIYGRRPAAHVDIGSRIDGFVAHVLSFMPVTVVDIRPIASHIAHLHFIQDDATSLIDFPDNSIDSLSSLHAAEHFGLGRYSDPVDPHACFRFMASLQRVLGRGGRLYFSVPIGRERVEFNAHRVFSPRTVLSQFAHLSLVSFSYVDDAGQLHEHCGPMQLPHLEYGCGLFEFTKEE